MKPKGLKIARGGRHLTKTYMSRGYMAISNKGSYVDRRMKIDGSMLLKYEQARGSFNYTTRM